MKKISLICLSLLLVGLIVTNDNNYQFISKATNYEDVSGGDKVSTENREELGDEATQISEEIVEALTEVVEERPILALVYLSDDLKVRNTPSQESEIITSVASGQSVQIIGADRDEVGELWVEVSFSKGGMDYIGYLPRYNIATSDERFLEWEESHGMSPSPFQVNTFSRTTSYPDIEAFPESYRAALSALKAAHPNWTFVKMETGLDWNTVVDNQLIAPRSLMPSSMASYLQAGLYSSGWAYPTRQTLEYYLDPRNGLSESGIFQHELLTYNATYHTEAAVQSFLENTFMKSSNLVPGTILTFHKTFWAIGAEIKVSPFHLAARVYQEQGQGTSPLISGTYAGYEGYYNYFNVGASGSTNTQIFTSGLTYAKNKDWSNGYKSIYGGAEVISKNYILRGQDTLYLQKFDVDKSYDGLYWHQYMQNICAPSSEGSMIKKLYEGANSLENTFVFKIPVYNHMPATASPLPTASTSVTLSTTSTEYTDGKIYLDGIAYSATVKEGNYTITAPNSEAKTAVMYKYNASGIAIGMTIWELTHDGKVYTATHCSNLEDLLSYHGFSIRITGRTGIRVKSGVDGLLRRKLVETGVDGYLLKEYGTLVMKNENVATLPFVLGGEKVMSGMAYGQDSSGTLLDNIYETRSGRYRYTMVLVGLPVAEYKTEFAFRSYAILEKNGQQVKVYGPVVSRSLYTLANQVISTGEFGVGSEQDMYLRQMISDADAQ